MNKKQQLKMPSSAAWMLLEAGLKLWAKAHKNEFEKIATAYAEELNDPLVVKTMSKSEKVFKSIFVKVHKFGDYFVDTNVIESVNKISKAKAPRK